MVMDYDTVIQPVTAIPTAITTMDRAITGNMVTRINRKVIIQRSRTIWGRKSKRIK